MAEVFCGGCCWSQHLVLEQLLKSYDMFTLSGTDESDRGTSSSSQQATTSSDDMDKDDASDLLASGQQIRRESSKSYDPAMDRDESSASEETEASRKVNEKKTRREEKRAQKKARKEAKKKRKAEKREKKRMKQETQDGYLALQQQLNRMAEGQEQIVRSLSTIQQQLSKLHDKMNAMQIQGKRNDVVYEPVEPPAEPPAEPPKKRDMFDFN